MTYNNNSNNNNDHNSNDHPNMIYNMLSITIIIGLSYMI